LTFVGRFEMKRPTRVSSVSFHEIRRNRNVKLNHSFYCKMRLKGPKLRWSLLSGLTCTSQGCGYHRGKGFRVGL